VGFLFDRFRKAGVLCSNPSIGFNIKAAAQGTCGLLYFMAWLAKMADSPHWRFCPAPKIAAEEAAKQHKLPFVLHVSGNFEDSGFA
jgi:hypothetical protein